MQVVIWLAAIAATWLLYRVSKWLYTRHDVDLLGVDDRTPDWRWFGPWL
jgi:hypothetical protein